MTMTLLFNLALCGYAAALLCAVINLFPRRRYIDWAVNGLLGIANTVQLAYVIWRWVEAGRPPFSNMFESLVLFAWAIVFIFLVVRFALRMPVVGTAILGAAVSLMATAILAFASTYYKLEIESEIKPLVAALQSNWLTFHVITCFLGYAGLAVSFVAAVAYLIIYLIKRVPTGTSAERSADVMGTVLNVMEIVLSWTAAFGFIFLTIGIITGSVWAKQAWGDYWSWDPKETWSLITWVVYAIFVHCRYVRGWSGWPAAVISVCGFASLLFTYFGVNYLLSGLHSYGQ